MMLSRSSSTAGAGARPEGLRRAKSAASTATRSSGHRRTETSIDPFVTDESRRHAEKAALEAFQRARWMEDQKGVERVGGELQRRKSTRMEGRHFEEARRRSVSKQREERKAMGRKKSSLQVGLSQTVGMPLPPSSTRDVRRARAGCSDGSPAPRGAQTIQGGKSFLDVTPKRAADDSNITAPSEFGEPLVRQEKSVPGAREAGPTESNGCSTNNRQRGLRETKSFIRAPFAKLRSASAQKSSPSGFDTGLPPFNHADQGLSLPPMPPAPPPPLPTPGLEINPPKKNRNFSESLKGRFRKVFRKTTKGTMEMPAQQVEATRLHYHVQSPTLTTLSDRVQHVRDDNPLTVSDPHPASPDNAMPDYMVGEDDESKSRVTSWTNSTVANTNTCSTRAGFGQQDFADEQGRLPQTGSVSTLRKASSFFGRPMKTKLRRPSKQDFHASEESAGLYSALEERIRPGESASQTMASPCETQQQGAAFAGLDSLPSRQQPSPTVSNKIGWPGATTIRTVTPDPSAGKVDFLSPVTEAMSPGATVQDGHSDTTATPRSTLRRRPAVKAPTPSKEQIARRLERSKNRWQSPLDEMTPASPMPMKSAMQENPYELRSLSHTHRQPLVTPDLPHHARVESRPLGTVGERTAVLSPSLYSRATDGASPRPETPVQDAANVCGTVVTITGREVKRYEISPPRPEDRSRVERPTQTSGEWRRWLAEEMDAWAGPSAPKDQFDFGFAAAGVEGRDADCGEEKRVPDEEDGKLTQSDGHLEQDHQTREPTVTARPSVASMRNIARSKSALGLRDDVRAPSDSTHQVWKQLEANTTRAPSNPPLTATIKPRSAFDLRGRYKNRIVCTARPIDAARRQNSKLLYPSAAATAAEHPTHASARTSEPHDTVPQHICAGPYAGEHAPRVRNENTPPASSPQPLPVPVPALQALPSSEWLAAGVGAGRRGEERRPSMVHPALRDRGASSSPSPMGGGSPGQRLVTSWLDGKGGAFV